MRQKGFTLIEVLVALAIGAVILLGIVLSIHQIMFGTNRSNSQVVALTDINNAALSIKKDLMMTQSTDLPEGGAAQSRITLTWNNYSGFESANQSAHSISYFLSGTELQRTYDYGTASIVGRHITYLGFTTQNNRFINVVITATGPGTSKWSETLEFSVNIRAEVIE